MAGGMDVIKPALALQASELSPENSTTRSQSHANITPAPLPAPVPTQDVDGTELVPESIEPTGCQSHVNINPACTTPAFSKKPSGTAASAPSPAPSRANSSSAASSTSRRGEAVEPSQADPSDPTQSSQAEGDLSASPAPDTGSSASVNPRSDPNAKQEIPVANKSDQHKLVGFVSGSTSSAPSPAPNPDLISSPTSGCREAVEPSQADTSAPAQSSHAEDDLSASPAPIDNDQPTEVGSLVPEDDASPPHNVDESPDHEDDDAVSIASVGSLLAIDTDRIRYVPITPRPPMNIVQDSILPTTAICPVIYWGVLDQYKEIIVHHMAFPPGRRWEYRFDPTHPYWPSHGDRYFEWFYDTFPNYSFFLHRWPHESRISHNNQLLARYRLLYPRIRAEATRLRLGWISSGVPPAEVERRLGECVIIYI
jgi:hypothetical protein